MLKALYDYAIQKDLVLPPGYVNKSVRAYIALSAGGKLLGIEQPEGETLPCPDIGSLANSGDKCNVLAEKASVILSEKGDPKSTFFRRTLSDGAEAEPNLALCLHALEDPETFAAILAEARARKVKGMDRISFSVDGVPVVRSQAVGAWWQEYRRQFSRPGTERKTLCLITGEPTSPLATVPPVNGLAVVGGHARGDALICFDKSAFCSYGLKQAANAPVSEEAFAAIKAALDDLLADAPVLAGMKFVHWYERPVPRKEDCIVSFLLGGSQEGEEDGEEDEEQDGVSDSLAAERSADALIASVRNGQHTAPLQNRYHILLLTGATGRVMIRRYEQGSYEELQQNLVQWERDLELCNVLGTGTVKSYQLVARLLRLLKRQKNDPQPFKRADKELSGLTPAVLMAILSGTALPDTVAARALAYIRSQMLDVDDELSTPQIPDAICCQWLKAWLLRRNREKSKEESLMPDYNPSHPSAAYHCGALMAVYAAIQRTAMPDVNAGVVQRYYASASRMPALALGQLERLSTYHLAKIENPWVVQRCEEHLNQIYSSLNGEAGKEIPAVLDLEEQAYFALGYRQMAAQLMKEKKERQAEAAAKKEKDVEKNDNQTMIREEK